MKTRGFRAGTAEGGLLESYFHPPRLTALIYRDFLQNFFPQLLQDVRGSADRSSFMVHP
jgi:hypothetical protein